MAKSFYTIFIYSNILIVYYAFPPLPLGVGLGLWFLLCNKTNFTLKMVSGRVDATPKIAIFNLFYPFL